MMYASTNGAKPETVISVRGVSAGYEGDIVLQDVDLTVHAQDFVGIIGPNGGGKSTLLKVLLGLLPLVRGEIQIMGEPVRRGRRHVGYVPQHVDFDHAFPIRVWDVVEMGRLGRGRMFRRFSDEDNAAVEDALNNVGMLDFARRPIRALSGGQRQRVYIARALASQPRILLLDEPTASVDPESRGLIYEMLRELNERGITILLISHDVGTISSYVKTVGCLNHRLYYHNEKELTQDMVDAVYGCPVDLIAHGVPHRVFPHHHHHEHLEAN